MPRQPRILWIEDSARYELTELLGPVYHARKYRVTLAEDASSAMDYLLSYDFDVVIVDIRLPPGSHQAWQDLYEDAKRGQVKAHLGLQILQWLFGVNGRVHAKIPAPPEKVCRDCVAVFTVESQAQIREELELLGIKMFKQKTTMLEDKALLRIIEKLIERRSNHHVL